MANFPTLSNTEDARKYGFDTEDVGMRSDMEGGYVLTRPRHTRAPRRIWKTGFTAVVHTDYQTFLDFWMENGTFTAFTYTTKIDNEAVNVRFSQKPTFKYVGLGETPLWDIDDIVLEEV